MVGKGRPARKVEVVRAQRARGAARRHAPSIAAAAAAVVVVVEVSKRKRVDWPSLLRRSKDRQECIDGVVAATVERGGDTVAGARGDDAERRQVQRGRGGTRSTIESTLDEAIEAFVQHAIARHADDDIKRCPRIARQAGAYLAGMPGPLSHVHGDVHRGGREDWLHDLMKHTRAAAST